MIKRRLGVLLAGTVLGTSFLLAAPAFADDAQLQQQIDAMQRQLNAMQAQLAQTKAQAAAAKQQANAAQQQATTAQQQTSVAQQNLQNIPPDLYNAELPIPTKGPSFFDTIHISLAGSFIAMEGAFRVRNENSSGASDPNFGSIPLANSPLYYQNELRFSAQQSRIALKASGDIDPAQHLVAYWENDWLGAGVTPNSRESNSYNLRIRQAYFGYANDYWGAHFSAGQMWSLLTQNRVGILNGTENIPLTIDAQYVTGFNWARQPAIRWVEDWNKFAWFAVSVESPQTTFVGNGNGVVTPSTFTAANGLVPPPGININPFSNCNAAGLLNSTTDCSINVAPDIIEKVAIDPGWGHYEALGLQRWFTDMTIPCVGPQTAGCIALPGAGWSQKTTFGWGVGGNALVPVWPKFVDLQGSVLYGQGIGRYASGVLGEVVAGPTGTLTPITEVEFLLGAIAHPWTGSDWYVYYGQEQTQRNAWTVAGTAGGYGNLGFAMSGCAAAGLITGNFDGTIGSSNFNGSSGTCAANVQRIQEITVGFWQDFYKGDLGRMRYGLQYEWIQQDLFNGIGSTAGGLHPNNNIVFFSLRYYPFN